MEDDIQLTPSPEAPDANSVQPDANNAPDDADIGEGRVFDITDDLNISPAVDVAVKPATPKPQTTPLRPIQVPRQSPPAQTRPAYTPVPSPVPGAWPETPVAEAAPVQPRKPAAIPLSDFSASLEKAKTINSGNASMADFGQMGKLPTEIGKDPVAQNPNLKPLRTYEGDVAEVLSHNKTSTASIAIAEAKKQEGAERMENEEESSHTGKKLILALLSLILIGGGAAGAYYFYSKSPLASVTPQAPAAQPVTSLIPADNQEVLPVNGLGPSMVLSKIQSEVAKTGTPNTITEIIPVQSSAGQSTRVSAHDMLSLMEIAPPDILTRSLDQDWMLGIYTDASGARSAFVVVSTNFFQNAFAGMLQWENVMADDLKQYLTPGGSVDIANIQAQPANSTADTNSSILPLATSSSGTVSTSTKSTASTTPVTTSTVPSSTFYSLQGHFVDRIILNKDVRAFETNDGKTLFLYSFIDNSKLVVAGNEAALSEILTRLEKQAFVR